MYLLTLYAMQFVGVPYISGGADPAHGLDCSGLVQILLRSTGQDPPGDQTAQALYDYYAVPGRGEWNRFECGSLVFFGKDVNHVSHVAMLLEQNRMIEAAGGDATTKTMADAKARQAFVKISLIDNRKDRLAIIRPYYSGIKQIRCP